MDTPRNFKLSCKVSGKVAPLPGISQTKVRNWKSFWKPFNYKKMLADQNKCSMVLMKIQEKVAGLQAWNFIKKCLQHRCFPVNTETFLRTNFFLVHLLWLLIFSLLIRSRFLTGKNTIAIKSVLRTLTNFYDKAFWKNSYQLLAYYYFHKKLYHRCLTRC